MKRFIALMAIAAMLAAQPAFCANADEYGFTAENGVITSYTGKAEYILVPAESDGKPVTAIGEKAFAGQRTLDVQIESGVKSIGKDAFRGAEMSSLTLCNTMESVAAGAFADCTNLNAVTLVNFDTLFEKGAFANTGRITFFVSCEISSSEEQRLSDKLEKAKGDKDFTIEKIHDYAYNEAAKEYKCNWCGDSFTGEGGLADDGRGPDETDDPNGPMDGGGPDASQWGINGDGKWGEPTFSDVASDAWYFDYVETAAEMGILNGKGDGKFAPDDNITVAEAVKIAACAYAEAHGATITGTGENWYDKYVDYAKSFSLIEPHIELDYTKPATRAEIAYLFSRADITKNYINDVPITDIPDVDGDTPYYHEIIDMFNLGAAVGSDAAYTFHPNDNIKRSEAAAMIVRIVDPSYRIDLPKG